MKVYCKNCTYCDVRGVSVMPLPYKKNIIWYRCFKLTVIFRDAIGYLRIKDIVDCNVQNKDNNCKHYKRKWWKFWIKEK